eukprot:CAMPEP_0117752790 /NCGR_PEP_ID=MMETSP0947-20121206/11834_1 /TAXON_ID=44440 /ORGANISM="Chattonella subsalsa, Strain CCMP2191" /LENGTH=457 /DNA_ID=CAMNT_0005571537 /DNA_START=149 /DNA_END=1522 /DNA_ORIENTATION=+
MRMSQNGGQSRLLQTCSAPSWNDLQRIVEETSAGADLKEQIALRETGSGLPNTDCKVRLFGTNSEPRVVLFRDTAAWCPYCQKVWIQLEEKQIPYRIEKINMRSYGDKPRWFLEKVPNGLLPAMELDGEFMTDSMRIMQVLEEAFPEKPMLPPPGSELRQRAGQLLQLERNLFYWWCQYCFRPGEGMMGKSKKAFAETLKEVNDALEMTEGPWFLGGEDPSIVDLAYVTHIERMVASLLYWKGFQIRKTEYPAIDRWLEAFEQRPSYMATKSDYYTHVMDIPPQYGPGFFVDGAEPYKNLIEGNDGSWSLPLPEIEETSLEPCLPTWNDEYSRHHAAYCLINNAEAVVKFALRGAGSPGLKGFSAPLADPYAQPNMAFESDIDGILRHVANALLEGTEAAGSALGDDLSSEKSQSGAKSLERCLAYLRDRVGVPRDMPLPAARQLRAHLNWAIDAIS